MRMIPPLIDVNAPSGEKEIFQLLKDTNSKIQRLLSFSFT